MALATDLVYKAPYAQQIQNSGILATAGIALDATTSDMSVGGTAGTQGGLCVGARFNPMGTTTAGIVWLGLSDDGGSTFHIYDQQTVAAETITATSAAGTPIDFMTKGAVISEDNPLRLGASGVVGFGFSTTITPSPGHAFFVELEDF